MRLTKLLGFVMACALVFNSTSIAYAAEANPSDRETPVITQQAIVYHFSHSVYISS